MELNDTIPKKKFNIHGTSKFIIRNLENYFYWHGQNVSKRPYLTIFLCLLFATLCGIGLMNFTTEDRPFKLWIPQESNFIDVFNWQNENFPMKLRPQFVLFESDNVLKKKVLLEILKVHNIVLKTTINNNTFNDICTKIPKLGSMIFRKKRWTSSRTKRQINWLASVFRSDYCYLLESIETDCFEQGVLEVWGYDEEILQAKTQEEIYNDINSVTKSAVFGTPLNISKYLGNIKYDLEGKIIGAGAARQIWATNIDYEAMKNGDNYVDDTGIGMVVDKRGFDWEGIYVESLLNHSKNVEDPKIFVMALSSFGRISSSAIFGDAAYFALGFSIVYIYVQIMLGKFNCVEQRPILSLLGISCIGLAIVVSYGLCSVFSVPFGPVNNVLPFLLLGLGVDDMFVIMQAWNTLSPDEKKKNLSERMGFALKHAGVSITITSVTDFMAFAIGCTTVLPALRSFCLYAAVGIISVYIFQATFFVAWFSLDQRRMEDHRNGMLWFFKMENWQPNNCSQKDLCQMFFERCFSRILCIKFVKVLVILLTLGLFGTGCWGLSQLRQEFNPIWFLPQNSYLYKYKFKMKEYFPDSGYTGVIYFSGLNLYKDLPDIIKLAEKIRSIKYIDHVDSWAESFERYQNDRGYDLYDENVDEEQFYRELGEFLYSPEGSVYKAKNFMLKGNFTCVNPIPEIEASSIEFRHKRLHTSHDRVSALDQVWNTVESMNFTGYVKPMARIYSSWETDKIIEVELYRNLGMAMGIVFLLTFILIASFTTSFMVLVCVLFTMVDVGAIMHWWGLTIDTVSCIDLILAIGLCVDYAAHIGHTFMTQKGSRDERMQLTLVKIGPAVLNGGFSTFLAFIFLANSDSHVFKTFFKIFFSVSLFGLYHGLVFLPVILSIMGPKPYSEGETHTPDIPEAVPFEESAKSGKNGVTKYVICKEPAYLTYETSL